MERPLIGPLLALMAGIVCSSLFDIPDSLLIFFLIVSLMSFLFSTWTVNTTRSLFFILAAFFACGWLYMNVYLHHPQPADHIVNNVRPEAVSVEGIICEPPHFYPEKADLMVDLFRMTDQAGVAYPVSGKILLSFRGKQTFAYGDVVSVHTRLRRVRNFRNPGGFDYERYLRYQGVLVRGAVADDSRIVVIRQGYGNPLRRQVEKARRAIRAFIDSRSPAPEKDIIKACILGDQWEIPRELRDAFSKTGTSHIIAISGFNMGLVAFFSVFAIRWAMRRFPYLLLRFDMYKVSVSLAIPPVILYTFIAGAGMSVLRATLMILAFMAALLIGKTRDLYNTLAMAALIILIIFPPALFDVSFQLSFAAVSAILFIAPRLAAWIPKPPLKAPDAPRLIFFLRKQLYAFALFLLVSLSAMLGTLPLIALYFNRISLVAFFANILMVPILGILAIPVSMATILLLPFSPFLSGFFLDLAGTLVMVSLRINDFFAALPWASVYLSTPNLGEIFFFYVILACLLLLLPAPSAKDAVKSCGLPTFGFSPAADSITPEPSRPQPPVWVCYVLAAGIIFYLINGLYYIDFKRNNRFLTATAIDVGQGSATLVRFPGDKTMLIDGGGFPSSDFDVGKYVVAPYLWGQRIDRIDIVVLTHPHPDHLKGLPFILENFSVGEVWTNGQETNAPEYKLFHAIIGQKGIRRRISSALDEPSVINGVEVACLNPLLPQRAGAPAADYDEMNELSLVIKMTYGTVSFLFTGDISSVTESRLISLGRDLRSRLLMVPHHGSRFSTSEDFLRAVRPAAAIISVGADNLFRLPHRDVLARLKQSGAEIYRTDLDGAVTASTDGATLDIESFRRFVK